MPLVAKPGFNYWDGRPPKTHILDTGSTSQGPPVVEYVDRQNLFPNLAPGTKVKLILDETVIKTIGNDPTSFLHPTYTIWVADKLEGDLYGILLKPVDGISLVGLDGALPLGINYKTADDAVVPLTRKGFAGTNDISELTAAPGFDLTARMMAVNPIWPTNIPAGDGSPPQSASENSLQPVVVVGRVETWNLYDAAFGVRATAVFVIKNVVFPVTIIRGFVGPVSGSFDVPPGYAVLWGKDPYPQGGESIKSVINPFGEGEGYCLIMQITNGQWQCIDLGCPPSTP